MSTNAGFRKYELQRRSEGKLNLPNPVHETAIHLISKGNTPEQTAALLPELSLDEINKLLEDPLAQKRLEWKKKNHGKPRTPKTAAEFKRYAMQKLYKLAENDKLPAKDRVSALKNLGALANLIDETVFQQSKPQESADLKELKEAFGQQSEGDE